ncbi:low molecular weight phosphatase family protein [Agromyces sp. Marseille-P2726]|uniref:arsenate reductase/protein-tyrosine-phosphatase family protein n=1 Tax=Agromyces sp. Marseille-P2726 TaxID=2709132 RepID=UPI00156E8C95|nr:low molecular weight phosphatase family protein [Agromyces sp. Marseille-P2726]
MSFRILTVCSGNICRSPLAEQLLRAGLAGIEGVTVSSAGTYAMVGDGMPAEAAAIAARYGVTDAAAHVARQVDEQLIRDVDLVLGLSREHRRAIVELVPAVTRRTFTLREFAHLAASVTDADLDAAAQSAQSPEREPGVGAKLREAVVAAASLRGVVQPFASPDDADVVDPFRRSAAIYESSAAQLVPAVKATVALLIRAAERA